MQFVDKAAVENTLAMDKCIELMKETLVRYSRKEAVQKLRTAMRIDESCILGIMPAADPGQKTAGAKIITVIPQNFQKNLPSHQGVVVLFETETGSLLAIVDGEAVTGIRTAAVSAAATDALARRDSHALCMLGSGLQARRHLEAIRLVRDIRQVRVWDVSKESSACYAKEMQALYGIPVLDCAYDVAEAVTGADIVCTVTAAKEPILFREHISPGTHINAVGACTAVDRELDSSLVQASRLFGDSVESVRNESGDFLIPLREGCIGEAHLLGEIGQVLSGNLKGRTSDSDITVFEALGLAVEDLAASRYIMEKITG